MTLFYGKAADGSYGFFDDTIHTTIPQDAVEISAAEHYALLEGQSSGKVITRDASGKPILRDPTPPALSEYQASIQKAIDEDAETLRSIYITATPGQVATYIMKYNDAVAFKTANYTGTVPGLIQAEMDATDTSAQVSTDDIIAQYTAWNMLAGAIEKVRRTAKVAVTEATTLAAVDAARTGATAGFAAIKAQAGAAAI
ncbi:hypothetical protein D3C87_460150 [compost metagenome]